MTLTLVVAAALTCMPAPFEAQTISSADGGFTLDVKRDSLTLREGSSNAGWCHNLQSRRSSSATS